MPDKDYIKRVYSFMDNAYGKNGAVSKGAFSGNFDQFYNKISSDDKYAEKVFGAMSTAYGPGGVFKKDAFTSDITTFRNRVVTPRQAPADAPISAEEPPTSDPVQTVLQTGTDIAVPEQTAPKYFQDIKSFEPDIKATEALNQAQRDYGKRMGEKYLLGETPQPIKMQAPTGKEAVDKQLTDPNKQYQTNLHGVLQKLDEEDKNRLSSQTAADEIYKTPQGKLYYDFVRPIYKTALETAGQTGAFGARLFNADKVADKIVDYFDFDRLAREGNPTASLNMEPTKQQGKLGINNILPRSVEAITNMGMLMGGASALGGGKLGLLGSSFATQYEDYRKTAKTAGLSDVEADKYAITGAGVNSLLEMISPNEAILNGTRSFLTKKSILDAIKNGASVKAVLKTGLKDGLKEIGKENAQELTQAIGDNAVKYAFDKYVLNDPRFNQDDILPSAQQALETVVLTSIATGVMSTPGLVSKNKVPSLERSAWAAAAENPAMVEQGLTKAVSEGQITQQKADELKQDVADYKSIYRALAAKGYDKEAVERMAINAYRSKKIDEQNKPIAGIPVLNSITAQDEAAKGDIERNIISAASGQPETEYDAQEEEITPSGITVQQPEQISRPQTITIGQNIQEPLNTEQNAIQEQSPREMDVRQQAENGEGVGEGNAVPEIATAESGQIQPEGQEEIVPPQQDRVPSMVPEEIKVRRDQAIGRLKSAWDSYKTTGIINDPERNLKRDKEFYSALTNYVKEEILYRSNQVKGFAQQKKAQIKRAITSSLKQEGIGVQDISMLNDAFEEAYSETKKIPGILPEEANDRISFRQYIKDRIKVRESGRKKGIGHGVGLVKERIKSVKSAIQETLKGSGVNLSMIQKRRLLSLLQNSATGDINKSVERATNEVSQMIWEAKNKQKITQTKGLIKSLSKLKRSKSMVQQDVEWIKQLQLPIPSKVDDLETYQDMLNDYIQSRKGNEFNTKYTKEEITEFVDQENERIYREKRGSMLETLDDLKAQGVLAEDVSLDEYIGMLDNNEPGKVSEGISKKQEILKAELAKKLQLLEDRLPEFEGDDKAIVRELGQVDPAYLNTTDLIRLNNVLNNIAEFGTLDGAGDIVTTYEAKKATEELAASENKIRELPSLKVLDRKNLSNFMSALFYNDKAIADFREKTIGGIENKVSHVKNQAQKVVKEFATLNKKAKINGLSNNKLHVYSYLNQYRGIENGEITDDLKRKVDDLVDDAKYVYAEAERIEGPAGKPFKVEAKNRLDALKELGLIDYSMENGKLNVDITENFNSDNPTTTLDQMWNSLTSGEQGVYQFARDHYDSLTDKLEDVTRNYAGKSFQRERNYISLVPRRKKAADQKTPELSPQTDILVDLKSVNSRPSPTTVERSDKKSKDIYYDSDFFSNFINRYYTSLYTSEVLPDLQRVAKIINSSELEKFLTGQFDEGFRREGKDNYEKFKTKIAEAINEEKYSPFFKKGKTNIADEVVNKGVRLILGNVWQGPKQYIPALIHNVTVNDHRALRYAVASRGMAHSTFHPEYAKARKEFLNHFTGVQRSAVGSSAYDQYVKRIDDNMAWWQHPLEWLDNVRKVSSFVLEKADHAAQNDAYIASYITSLLREGKIKSIKDFDLQEHAKNPDKKALAYAEQIASNINNESAKAYRPAVLKDSDKARNLWLLQGFALNAYQNAMNKAKIIFDNRATGAEKKEAAFHFLGYLGELSAYQLVGKWARNLQAIFAASLLSALFNKDTGEDEETKVAKKKKEDIKMLANMGSDIAMSGLSVPYQTGIKLMVNYAYTEWAKHKTKSLKKEAKEKGEKFDPKGTYLSPYFKPFIGAEGPGGAAEFYTSLGQKVVDAVSKAANSDDKTPEEQKAERLMNNLNHYLGIPAAVLGAGDLMILNNKMQQALKQKAASDKKNKTPHAAKSNRSARKRRTRNRHIR